MAKSIRFALETYGACACVPDLKFTFFTERILDARR